MNSKTIRTTLTVCFLVLCALPLFGQATFTGAAASTIAADIGVTELTGRVVLTVTSGTTVASPLLIHYSAKITNEFDSEISVSGTGGLSGIASSAVVDRTNNNVQVNVPAGGHALDLIQIDGVRVAIAGQGLTNVTARITAAEARGNAILSGEDTMTVISSIQKPMSVTFDPSSLRLNANIAGSATTSLTISELYPAAFSSAVHSLGQTVPAQIRINPFPSIPHGVTLTFARTVTCTATGAVFTTLSNQDETVPRADGSTSVVYQFTAGATSSLTLESFPFSVTATVTPPADTGSITFQATLLPIGIAVADSVFPSTDIPRYTERAVPDETDLQTGSVQLAFPFPSQTQSSAYTGLAITNPIPFRVKVSLAAYDCAGNLISGSGITNPVDIVMPRSGQFAKLAGEIFGANFNASSSGTIVATGSTSILPGFYMAGGTISAQDLDGAIADLIPVSEWVMPTVFHAGPSPTTLLRLFNPGTSAATATLHLRDSSGVVKATATVTVPAGGTQVQDVRTAFSSVDLNSISGGYLTGTSSAGLVATETFGNTLDSNVLRAQVPVARNTLLVPHFVNGGGYSTELNLVNMDANTTANLTLTAFDSTGAAIGGNPVVVSLAPGNQYIRTVDQIFRVLGNAVTSGYIRIDSAPYYFGPFPTTTPIAGSIRFTSASGVGSTALPISLTPSASFVYSHVAQDLGYFSGIAMINSNPVATDVTVQVFNKDGGSVGSASVQLQPGQKLAKLVSQLVPASAGQVGGYVSVHSTLPITSFSLFGTDDGKLLSAIPPQNINQ